MLETLARLPRRMLMLLVRGYQLIISPHTASACNFTPTCSGYAIEALEKYGAVRGTILAVHRILRCHPWGGHGYDPPVWYSERKKTASENAGGAAPGPGQ